MAITNIISAIGNTSSVYPLILRDCGVEIPSKVYLTYQENKNDKEVAFLATRERIIDEYATSAVWLGGIPLVEKLINKFIIAPKGLNPAVNLKLFKESDCQGIDYNIKFFENKIKNGEIPQKAVKNIQNAINDLKNAKNNKKLYEKLLASKFLAATVIPIALMGFVIPKMVFGLTAKTKAAKKAHIPIITVDAPVTNKDLVNCTVVSDNYNAGVQCAKYMMSKLKSANIVLLKHTTALSAKQRIEGFLDTIDAHSEYKIINQGECKGQLEKAMPVMQRILKETPEVDVVMALNDPSALGALAALESMGYEDVMVYGVDGTPDIKSLIEESPMVAGTVAQSPISIGKIAAKNMYDLLSGKEIGSNIVIPVEIITKENIAQFNKTGWQ